jgi:ABC-2 type transport system permease protein
VGCGLAVGWRPHASAADVMAAAGLLILLRYAVSWAGVFIGLAVRNEETADQLVPLIFPVTMISNTFVPTTGMPTWLRAISDWNPVSALVAALRHLLGSSVAPGAAGAWPLAHPVGASLLWAALLLALFVPLSVRRYATTSR